MLESIAQGRSGAGHCLQANHRLVAGRFVQQAAQRASDIDVIYVYGYGVPAYLGGPMFYADQIGLDKVYQRVCDFAAQDPASWKPAPLLKRLAESGGTFN